MVVRNSLCIGGRFFLRSILRKPWIMCHLRPIYFSLPPIDLQRRHLPTKSTSFPTPTPIAPTAGSRSDPDISPPSYNPRRPSAPIIQVLPSSPPLHPLLNPFPDIHTQPRPNPPSPSPHQNCPPPSLTTTSPSKTSSPATAKPSTPNPGPSSTPSSSPTCKPTTHSTAPYAAATRSQQRSKGGAYAFHSRLPPPSQNPPSF